MKNRKVIGWKMGIDKQDNRCRKKPMRRGKSEDYIVILQARGIKGQEKSE